MAETAQFRPRSRAYHFDAFEAVADTGELRKNGVRVKLHGQPCQILLMLLQANGEVVSREALRAALWSADTFVDFEHSLNTAVKKLRQALGDDADQPRYIETVPRAGYRFIARVSFLDEIQAPPDAPTAGTLHLAQIEDRSTAPPGRRALRLTLVAMTCLVLTGFVAIALHVFAPAHHLRITGTRQLTFHRSDWETFFLATDGRRVYFFKNCDSHLYSVPIAGGDETSAQTRFLSPVILDISPDGSTLLVKEYAFVAASDYSDRVWLQPTSGAPAHPLGDVRADFAAAWSPDGKTIAFAQQNVIYFTTDLGATYRRAIEAPGTVQWIRWSPDGQRLRFTVVDLTTNISSIWEARPNGKPSRLPIHLARLGALNFGFWTRDGKHFFFQNTTNERSDYWSVAESGYFAGRSEPEQLSSAGEIVFGQASAVDNQIVLVEHQSMTATFRFDPVHRVLTPYLGDRSVEDPAFSADGRWIAYIDQQNERNVLTRSRVDGSDAVPLTDPNLYARFPHFSPDGKQIAFMGKWVDTPWHIEWISADGGALHEINAPSVTNQADVNWMPDGKTILFGQTPWYMADPNTPRAIYLYDLKSEALQKVRNSDGWFSPRLSPDGRSFVALTADETKLGLYDFVTSKWRILFENSKRLGAPYWSPDGKSVYLNTHERDSAFSRNGTILRIAVSNGKTMLTVPLEQYLPNTPCDSWGLAPDGAMTISCWLPNANIYALQYEP